MTVPRLPATPASLSRRCSRLRGVIFDMDGTLVDSPLDFDAMRREIGCPPNRGLLEHIAALPRPRQRRRAAAVIERHERSAALNARWMPGADTLLHQLRERRLPLGIVTRNSRSPAALTLARLGAPPLQLLCREDARPKPDPDGLLQLARSWSLPPQALVYIGDFHFDLEAATAAGMLAGLYAPGEPPAFSARADFIFSDFASLAELLPGSGRPD